MEYWQIVVKYLENKGLLTRKEVGQLLVRIQLLEEQVEELKNLNKQLQTELEAFERYTG